MITCCRLDKWTKTFPNNNMTYLIDDMLEGALHSLLGTSQCLENQHRHSELP